MFILNFFYRFKFNNCFRCVHYQKNPDFTQEDSVLQPMPYVIVCILITEMRTILITETSQRPLPGYTLFTFRAINTIGGIFDAELLVNWQRKCLGNCNNEPNAGFENCTNILPVILKHEDKVNIRTTNVLLLALWSSFKGWNAW